MSDECKPNDRWTAWHRDGLMQPPFYPHRKWLGNPIGILLTLEA
jgi:hypothetical protein